MVNYKQDGKRFSSSFGGLVTVYKEIEAEEFERLSKLSQKEINKEIEDGLPVHVLCGYGYYGGGIVTRDDKKYVCYKRGTTCD